MNHIIDPMLRPLTRWAEHSQRGACRNAMVASTAIAASRRERDEVQEYVDELIARRSPRAGAAPRLRGGSAEPQHGPSAPTGDLSHQSGFAEPCWGTLRPWPRCAPLHVAPSDDDGLALRYYTVTSQDGTELQAWTNDVHGPTVLLCNGPGGRSRSS